MHVAMAVAMAVAACAVHVLALVCSSDGNRRALDWHGLGLGTVAPSRRQDYGSIVLAKQRHVLLRAESVLCRSRSGVHTTANAGQRQDAQVHEKI